MSAECIAVTIVSTSFAFFAGMFFERWLLRKSEKVQEQIQISLETLKWESDKNERE